MLIPPYPHEYWEIALGLEMPKYPPPEYRPHISDVYVMTAGEAVKVGISRNVASRARALQTGNEKDVRIFWAVTMNKGFAEETERAVHAELRKLAGAAATGEWFYVAPETAVSVIKRVIVENKFACKRHPAYDFDRGLEGDASDEGFARCCYYYS